MCVNIPLTALTIRGPVTTPSTGGSGTRNHLRRLRHRIINAGSGAHDVVYAGNYLNTGAGIDTIDGRSGHATCYVTTGNHVSNCAVIITTH